MSAEVVFASSFDEKYPPNNIFSSNKSMFWSSTGIYPQELIISLPNSKSVSEIEISAFNIKHLLIESCENDSAVKFTTQCEVNNIPATENKLQEIKSRFNSNSSNKIIKIIILEGYNDFCTVNFVNIK